MTSARRFIIVLQSNMHNRKRLTIRNVTVIDGSGGAAKENAEVAIEDGVFTAIRPSSNDPSRGPIFDGKGAYLVPGLWEGHTHLRKRPGEVVTDELARLESLLAAFLPAGITSVLELSGPLEIDVRLRDRRRTSPPFDAAEMFYAGPPFTGIDGWPLPQHYDHSLVREAADPESGRRMVLELNDKTDFIKCMYDGEPGAPDKLSKPAMRAIIEAAHDNGKNVLVHIRTKRDIEEAIDAGADGIEHCFVPEDESSETEAQEIAALLASTDTYFCPTFCIYEQIGRNGDRSYLDDLVKNEIMTPDQAHEVGSRKTFGDPFPHHSAAESLLRLRYGMRVLPIMRDAGVKIVAGSDFAMLMPRPAALLRELQLLARAGLKNGDVIVSASRHAAEKIGKGDTIGTIAVGQVADALLVNANPIDDIMHLIRPEHHVATIRRGNVTEA